MQNAAIAALGLDAVYVARHATKETFETTARGVLAAGGGINVTVPFKRQAAALLRVASEAVRRTGACNTVWGDAASPEGDNTDITGVREAARAVMGALPVRRVLLIGTGGSARAAAVAVADEWPGVTVGIVSRDEGRAREFVAWAQQAGVGCRVWGVGGDEPDLLINATPVGLETGDPLPVARETLARMAGVLDLVYARGETALVRAAREAGARAADGRGVLVAQGAAAFARFFGVSAPTATMRAAVEDALRP
jgi:shikimate dehydrogenase